MERELSWDSYNEEEINKIFDFSEKYRTFLTNCKTERECVAWFVEQAKAAGFVSLEEAMRSQQRLKAGDRIYVNRMNKWFVAFVIGKKSLETGMNILGAHIDSPRIDLKQNPLYEESGIAMLDTHYYGGIKKYQWVTIPMALHGVVAKTDGTVVNISIGDKPEDPVFGISDLLVHLATEQMDKKAAKVIDGESMNVMIGSMPLKNATEKEAVKANILQIIEKTYQIKEEDFLSAEIEVVPAGEARDYGFDRSMIMGYGHDDRVCAYPSFVALSEMKEPEVTSVCLLVDKEEIGNEGASSARSVYFENAVAELLNLSGD